LTGPDVYGLVADRAASDGHVELGVWDRLSDLLDPARYRPKLAEYVEIREFPLKWGNDYVMVANTRDLLHYRLPASELPLLRKMDGSRSVKELVLDEFEASGDLDPDAVTDLVRTLYEGNFLDQRYRDVDALVTRALDPVTSRSAARRWPRASSCSGSSTTSPSSSTSSATPSSWCGTGGGSRAPAS